MVQVKYSDITIDTHQFAFWGNRSSDDTVSSVVHAEPYSSPVKQELLHPPDLTGFLLHLKHHQPTESVAKAEYSWAESITTESGSGLPDQKTTGCQDQQHCLLNYPQHWLPPRAVCRAVLPQLS